MDVREKLVELLTDDLPRIGNFPKCDNPLQYTMDEIVARIADHLITNGVTVQEWISVKDRLPENEQNVLVADNGFIAVWTFYGDYWEDSHGWWQEFDEVTHWMPLPQPPKGE